MVEIFIFVFGSIIGSFLNVCIVRMPQDKSVVFPSSHCVHCQKPIAWHDNIPVLGWLMLGGRCRACKAPISLLYPAVELLTAAVFLAFYKYFGLQFLLIPYLFMASCFIVSTIVDLKHRIIPDEISINGMFAGIIFSALIPSMHAPEFHYVRLSGFIAGVIVLLCLALIAIYPIFCKHLMEGQEADGDKEIKVLVACSLIVVALINAFAGRLPASCVPYALSLSAALSGYIIGGGIIYVMGLVGDIIFKKESMGGGDVKLMALVGAFLGWKLALLTFFLAPFFGAVFGIIEKIRTKESTIAYGPFLVAGALMSLFWGNAIISWVLRGGIYGY